MFAKTMDIRKVLLLVVIVLVVAAALSFFFRLLAAPPRSSPAQASPAPPAQPNTDGVVRQPGLFSELVDVVGNKITDAVENEPRRKEVVERIETLAAKRKEAERSEAELKQQERQREMYEFLRQLDEKMARAYRELTPYHVAEAAIKEQLAARYGPVKSEDVDRIMAVAAELEKEFWAGGDFDNLDNVHKIREARALLEMCVAASPASDQALRQLCQVIWAGWPKVRSIEPDLRWAALQTEYDLMVCFKQLWTQCLSAKTTASHEELCLAWDFCWTGHRRAAVTAEELLAEFRRTNPNPSAELTSMVTSGVAGDDVIVVAQWAIDGIKRQDPSWECYISNFTGIIKLINDPALESVPEISCPMRSIRPIAGITEGVTKQLAERYRISHGRGQSFLGPPDKRHLFVPWHIIEQENKALEEEMARLKALADKK